MRGVALLVLGGCAARVGVGGAIDGEGGEMPGYAGIFAAWTQQAALHDGFQTTLLAKATLLGPQIVDAMVVERRSWVLGEDPSPPSAEPWRVVFTAASDLDDLGITTATKPAAWQASLLVDETRCTLDEVHEVKIDALTRRLYPNLSSWDRQWEASFSGCPALGEVQFQLTGAHGALEFGWNVGGDSVVAMRRGAVN